MNILPPIKLILQRSPAAGLAVGGIHLVRVDQDAVQPNIMLMQISGGRDYNHQGPSRLWDVLLRVYSRAQSDRDALTLGAAVITALERFRGISGPVNIQLLQHINSNSDFTDDLKIFRQIDDFRVHFHIN